MGSHTAAAVCPGEAHEANTPTRVFGIVFKTVNTFECKHSESSVVERGVLAPFPVCAFLLASLLATGLGEAQDSLRLTNASAAPATLVTTTVELTNTLPLEGFSLGVAHDPTMLTLTSIAPGALLDPARGGTDPDAFLVQSNPAGQAGATIACLLTVAAPPFAVIPVGTNQPVVDLLYQTGNSTGTTTLQFTNNLGSPPVDILMVSGRTEIDPIVFSGNVTISTVFFRGDCNGDGDTNLADATCLLRILFLGDPIICADAHDTDDNGALDIIDAVVLLEYMFVGGPTPPAPHPETGCGLDPTPDSLGCDSFGICP